MAFCWLSTTKNKPIPLHTDPVPPSTNRCCPIVTQSKTSSTRNAHLSQMDLVSCCIYINFVFTSFSYFKVPSTCQQNTYDSCQDVQKQKLVQVGTNSHCNFNQTCALFHLPIVYSWSTHRCPTLTARTCRSSNVQRCRPGQQQCLIWILIYQLNMFCDWIIEFWSYYVFPGSWTTVPTGALHRVTAGLLRLSLNLNFIFLSSPVFTIHPRPKVSSSIYDSLKSYWRQFTTNLRRRFAKTSTGRSLREWAGQCPRRLAEVRESFSSSFSYSALETSGWSW